MSDRALGCPVVVGVHGPREKRGKVRRGKNRAWKKGRGDDSEGPDDEARVRSRVVVVARARGSTRETGATSSSGTFLTEKQENESVSTRCFRCEGYCGNNVSAGVPAISCLSLERASRGALSAGPAGRGAERERERFSLGLFLSLSLSVGLTTLTRAHRWLRPATWLAKEYRTMGGSGHRAAHGYVSPRISSTRAPGVLPLPTRA